MAFGSGDTPQMYVEFSNCTNGPCRRFTNRDLGRSQARRATPTRSATAGVAAPHLADEGTPPPAKPQQPAHVPGFLSAEFARRIEPRGPALGGFGCAIALLIVATYRYKYERTVRFGERRQRTAPVGNRLCSSRTWVKDYVPPVECSHLVVVTDRATRRF